MIWHVHREKGAIVSAHQEPQPGYADEALDETMDQELAAFIEAGRNPVPATITPLQGRRLLRHLGIVDQVDAWVKTLGPDAVDAWEFSTEWLHGDQLITAAAAQFGLDPDEFFRTAGKL